MENKEIRLLVIDEENQNQRIDKLIADHYDDISRTQIQNMLRAGEILVNEKTCKPNYKLNFQDNIKIYMPTVEVVEIKPENIVIDILYEDDDLLIVNKPKNMVVHPGAGHISNTLVNALLFHCDGNLSTINGPLRPGIVHRIDKDTTGALIVCKTDFAHIDIAMQLKNHTITRKYKAIAQGILKEEQGIIDAPIGRDKKNRKKMAINHVNGKNSITHYKVLKTFNKYTFIECQLETGRTHQIRVHMASVNHPILGDTLYNPHPSPYKLNGQVLHAETIGFIHPRTGDYMEFKAEIPEYFQNLLNNM